MTIGKGKYDDALTLALKSVDATNGILLVFDGKHGGGFSVQGTMEVQHNVPALLEHLARTIRTDLHQD